MPKIPLYNQGAGQAVELATGQLSRRADRSAFTAPGRAIQSFSKTAGDIAFQFGQAEKNAETERVYAEMLAKSGEDFERFKLGQPAKTVPGFNIVAKDFVDGVMGEVDGMDLTRSQKRTIKNNLSKNLNTKVANARSEVFQQHQASRKDAFTKALDALTIDAAAVDDRDELLSEADYLITFAKDNGFDTGYTTEGIRYELDKKDFLSDSQNPNLDIGYFKQQLSDVNKNEGKFSNYNSAMQREMAGLIEGQITYLKTGVLAEAAQLEANAIDSINLTGDDGGLGNQASQKYRQAGDIAAANALDLSIAVAEDVYQQVYADPFTNEASDLQLIKKAQENARRTAVEKPTDIRKANLISDGVATAVAAKREALEKDPASFVDNAYRRKFGKEPTIAEQIQKQAAMGLRPDEIKPLTAQTATDFIEAINAADTPMDVVAAFSGVGIGPGAEKKVSADAQSYIMRQLSAAGMSLAQNYVANAPLSPMAGKLLLSSSPDAIKIQATPAAKTNIRSAIIKNETVQNHMKSMLGGSYADFANNQIIGSPSSTRAMNTAREQHLEMLTNLTLFLAQEQAKVVSGDDAMSKGELENIVSQAASILSERYSYVDGFPNSEVTLRIPKHLTAKSGNIQAALNSEIKTLSSETIFFESGRFEEGTVEFENEKAGYADEARLRYGWVIAQDGKTALAVGADGGLIFEYDDRGQLRPKSYNIEKAATYEPPAPETAIGQNLDNLENQRQAILDEMKSIGEQPNRSEEGQARLLELRTDLSVINKRIELESRNVSGAFTREGTKYSEVSVERLNDAFIDSHIENINERWGGEENKVIRDILLKRAEDFRIEFNSPEGVDTESAAYKASVLFGDVEGGFDLLNRVDWNPLLQAGLRGKNISDFSSVKGEYLLPNHMALGAYNPSMDRIAVVSNAAFGINDQRAVFAHEVMHRGAEMLQNDAKFAGITLSPERYAEFEAMVEKESRMYKDGLNAEHRYIVSATQRAFMDGFDAKTIKSLLEKNWELYMTDENKAEFLEYYSDYSVDSDGYLVVPDELNDAFPLGNDLIGQLSIMSYDATTMMFTEFVLGAPQYRTEQQRTEGEIRMLTKGTR